jgi:hypothetical protein
VHAAAPSPGAPLVIDAKSVLRSGEPRHPRRAEYARDMTVFCRLPGVDRFSDARHPCVTQSAPGMAASLARARGCGVLRAGGGRRRAGRHLRTSGHRAAVDALVIHLAQC